MYVIAQAAQAHHVWVRASEVIWSEYTRIISVISDAKEMQKCLTCLTCDKISNNNLGPESHVIMQEISTFVILKATSTDRQTRRLRIFKIFVFIWHQIIH